MNRTVCAVLAVLAIALCPPSVRAAVWSVDGAKSTLGFVGNQGGSSFDGRFARWQADIDFDPAHPASGHVVVTIDMTSATTGDQEKDSALPQSDWFDAKSFPQARFEATSFHAKGGNAYEAVGTLTIRGISKDVVLPFTLDVQGNTAHCRGRLPLLRTDYGVGQGAWKGADIVGLDVTVTVDLVATAKP
jgi:polyisoprenoid-binding protein YceI